MLSPTPACPWTTLTGSSPARRPAPSRPGRRVPYFDPPYDTEDGLTYASAEWIERELGLQEHTVSSSPMRPTSAR